jgi:hypothetical protein
VKKTLYEWNLEHLDDNGDIVHHDFADKLKDLPKSGKGDLVLVRDVFVFWGLCDRTWAYVENDTLPEYFQDSYGCECEKVPQKYHKELQQYLKNKN